MIMNKYLGRSMDPEFQHPIHQVIIPGRRFLRSRSILQHTGIAASPGNTGNKLPQPARSVVALAVCGIPPLLFTDMMASGEIYPAVPSKCQQRAFCVNLPSFGPIAGDRPTSHS
jgi:hypothetical protein